MGCRVSLAATSFHQNRQRLRLRPSCSGEAIVQQEEEQWEPVHILRGM